MLVFLFARRGIPIEMNVNESILSQFMFAGLGSNIDYICEKTPAYRGRRLAVNSESLYDFGLINLGRFHHSRKSLGVTDSHIRQHFAIDLDVGFLHPVDQMAVLCPIQAGGCVDA